MTKNTLFYIVEDDRAHHDVPDDQFADALAAQLESLVGDQEPEPPVALH